MERHTMFLDWKNQYFENDYQSWAFFGSTDAEAETPILWPSYVKS